MKFNKTNTKIDNNTFVLYNGGGIFKTEVTYMIVYDKLGEILKKRNMVWKDLCNAGISVNMPSKFSQNKSITTDILNRICEYLKVQPSEIMEWIPDKEYESQNAEKIAIEKKIAELQAKLKQM